MTVTATQTALTNSLPALPAAPFLEIIVNLSREPALSGPVCERSPGPGPTAKPATQWQSDSARASATRATEKRGRTAKEHRGQPTPIARHHGARHCSTVSTGK